MTRIVWTVQAVNEGYQAFVKVSSAVLSEGQRSLVLCE
jgi:hypothetical protein